MCKGWPLDLIREVIENRINKVVNTALGKTPYEVLRMYKSNPLSFKTYIHGIKAKKEALNSYHKMNRRRLSHNYKKGDLILIKVISQKKLDPLYAGPIKVLQVDQSGERLLLPITDRRNEWHNIKNVKPFWGGDDVMHEPLLS